MNNILNFIQEVFRTVNKETVVVNTKRLNMIKELEKLEEQYISQLADVERWGNINDNSHWRTVELNRIQRLIESKTRMLNMM